MVEWVGDVVVVVVLELVYQWYVWFGVGGQCGGEDWIDVWEVECGV